MLIQLLAAFGPVGIDFVLAHLPSPAHGYQALPAEVHDRMYGDCSPFLHTHNFSQGEGEGMARSQTLS